MRHNVWSPEIQAPQEALGAPQHPHFRDDTGAAKAGAVLLVAALAAGGLVGSRTSVGQEAAATIANAASATAGAVGSGLETAWNFVADGSEGDNAGQQASQPETPTDSSTPTKPRSAKSSQPGDCKTSVANLSDDVLLSQVLMPTYDPSKPTHAVARHNVGVKNQAGNVLLLSDPTAKTTSMLKKTYSPSGIPPLVAASQEGGLIQPIKGPGLLPSPYSVAQEKPAEVRQMVEAHGKKLYSMGVTTVLGPVIDLSTTTKTTGLPGAERTFSGNAQEVTTYGKAVANGWKDAGLMPVLKHFPGYGSVTTDAKRELPQTEPFDKLGQDLAPFRTLAKQKGIGVLVGHVSVPGLTGNQAASMSPKAVKQARELTGSNNLIFSDTLSDDALKVLNMNAPEAVLGALAAGVDVVPYSTGHRDPTPEIKAKLRLALISGEYDRKQLVAAVTRVLDAKKVNVCAIKTGKGRK